MMRRFTALLLGLTLLFCSCALAEGDDGITITGITNGKGSGSMWAVTLTNAQSPITVTWEGDEGPYTVSFGNSDKTVSEGTYQATYTPDERWLSGTYYLSVEGTNSLTTVTVILSIADASSGGGAMPGGGSSALPSGSTSSASGRQSSSFGSSSAQGAASSTNHTSGKSDRSVFNSVGLVVKNGRMHKLTMSNTELEVATESDTPFWAELTGESSVTCVPNETDPCWTVNMAALETLSNSGIQSLVLKLDDTDSVTIPTDFALTGRIYAQIRAEGPALNEYVLKISAEGIRLSVGEQTWTVDENHELR